MGSQLMLCLDLEYRIYPICRPTYTAIVTDILHFECPQQFFASSPEKKSNHV